jgi:hypothetical protein
MHLGYYEDGGQLLGPLTDLALGQDFSLQNGAVKGFSHISIFTEQTKPAGLCVSTIANP